MIGARRFVGCRFPFKQVQWWPSMPMTRIACCSITNEFFLETVLWICGDGLCERALVRATTVLSLCWRQQHISWLLWHNVSHIC
jgi:hypothetical protein